MVYPSLGTFTIPGLISVIFSANKQRTVKIPRGLGWDKLKIPLDSLSVHRTAFELRLSICQIHLPAGHGALKRIWGGGVGVYQAHVFRGDAEGSRKKFI